MSSPTVTFEVAARFYKLRRKYIALRVLTSAAKLFAFAVLCWSALALGDYFWEWPLLARRILAAIACAGLVLYSTLQISLLYKDSIAGQFAIRLERRFDSLGQRLRTVLAAVDGSLRAPEPMLSALGHQTLGRWETASPGAVLPVRSATVALTAGFVLMALAFVGLFVVPDWQVALMRGLGGERAYTELEVTPGNTRLLEGSNLKLNLQLHGRTNRDVTLRYRQSDEESWVESELLPNADLSSRRHAVYEASLGKLTNPIEYQFVTSAGSSALYRIDVQPFIQVEKFEAEVVPPAYTRLETRTFSTTELTVLAGSQVSFSIETNHPLSQASLSLGDKPSALEPMDVLKHDSPKLWSFELPTTASVYWQLTGKGIDGTPIAPIKGRLRIRYDEEPRIEWRDPPEEIKVHMLAELPMKAQVSDDYGLSESGIVFQVDGQDEYVLKRWALAEVEGATSDSVVTQLRLDELLPLESLLLSESDFLSYFAYAIDNREGNPHRIETDTRYIDIQPLRQFWSERDSDPNGMGGGGPLVPQLEEIIRRERFLINRTRRESRNQSSDLSSAELTEQLPKIERMVASQSELADLTRFLMEFLASQGNDDNEALGQAEAAMLQAVDSLTKADFASALVQEEDAGRALAEARNTLEVVLTKNQTPQRIAQMRAFARQMQQKLRRTPSKTDKQLADSLEQIASEQKQLAIDLERPLKSSDSQSNTSQTKDANQASESGEPSAIEKSVGVNDNDEVPANDKPKTEEIKPETIEQSLVERVRTLDGELSQAVKRSSLVTKRMEDSIKAMDELSGKLREITEDASKVPPESGSTDDPSTSAASARTSAAKVANEIADQLRELATHINALSQTEPANRISSLRDMTSSLSNMEQEVSKSMYLAAELRKSEESEPTVDSKLAQARETVQRFGQRLDDRASTIEDVLKIAPDLGSLEANEVNDRIQKFVAEIEFLEDLANSRAAMAKSTDIKETNEWAQDASSRGNEYADAALQLDSMYRQLVTPRTDQLRKLEALANQLSKALSQQNGGMGTGSEPQQKGKGGSVDMLKRELHKGLKEAELDELNEFLTGGGGEEMESQTGGGGEDPAFQESKGITDSKDLFSLQTRRLANGVSRVQKELRSRIQELVMLEIAADRDAPVPTQYRDLIDGYFRTIAGGDDRTKENVQ